MNLVQFIVLAGLVAAVHCLPVDNTITNADVLLDNEVKSPVSSVDQALGSPNKVVVVKLEETTTSSGQLFNNNEPEEDKIFRINEADDLIDLAPSSKQASGGMPNVQSLIDQTNTISSNLENMIKDMTQNKRHATAAMLKLMLQNVRRLNTSLVRLNNRVNSLPIIGNSQGSASSSGSTSLSASSGSSASASSSVSSSVSNATINAASQINNVVSNIRNQLNNVSNEINNLLSRIRLSMPGGGSSKPSTTPSG